MEERFVSEIIGDEYQDWTNEKPIVIHAQTGTGKTYFIFQKLLPYIHSLGKKMVYLSNRVALQQQVQQEVDPQYENSVVICNYQKFAYISFASNENERSSMTPQEREKIDLDDKIKSADYFVLDEAHFFLSDSSFNTDVGQCLSRMKTLRSRKRESIWIFMTATVPYLLLALCRYFDVKGENISEIPYLKYPGLYENWYFHDVNALLCYKEYADGKINYLREYWERWEDNYDERARFPEFFDMYGHERKNYFSSICEQYSAFFEKIKENCRYYNIKGDFSYLTTVYYGDDMELVDAIKRMPQDDKWLIFARSIKQGERLQQALIQCGYNDTVFITADNKQRVKSNAGKAFKSIVEYEMFPQKILIATKVLDNGINLKDAKLKHIVIDSFEETTFLQMIGRKRRINPSEKTNLYIRDISEAMIRKNFTNNILKIIQFWYSIKRIQARNQVNNTPNISIDVFERKYTKNNQYRTPFNNYIIPNDMNYSSAGTCPIKNDPGLLVDIVQPAPFAELKLTYDYYKMLAMFEQAQNQRYEQLKNMFFQNEAEYRTAEEKLKKDQHLCLREQLLWIEGGEYHEQNWITSVSGALKESRQALEMFLNEHEGILKKVEQDELKKLFCEFIKNVRPKHKHVKTKGSYNVIVQCLEEFGFQYRLTKLKAIRYETQRNWWFIEKLYNVSNLGLANEMYQKTLNQFSRKAH